MVPDNSFKPKPFRCSKVMAGKACHGFASTTRFGLTQASGRMMKIIASCCLCFLAFSASATKVRPVEIAELASESELIIFGKIQLSQVIDGDCGVRYVATIDESYKGNLKPGTSLLFSSAKPLTTGISYVLFLSKEGSAFDPILSTSSFGPRPDPERARVCARNRPRYTVNVWGNGALKVTGTYESSTRVAVFDDFMILMPKTARAKKLNPEDRYDIDKDSGGIDFNHLRKLLKTGQAPKHAP